LSTPKKQIFILSESGCPGLKDLQDEKQIFILSESGCPGLKDVQDEGVRGAGCGVIFFILFFILSTL
jgi:hypothetical protein